METSILQELRCAVTAHKTGNIQAAEGYYRAILTSVASPPAMSVQNELVALVHNNLGYLLQSQGSLYAAIDSYKSAVQCKADYYEAYNNLGIALRLNGELAESIDCLRKAIAIKPDYLEAHYNLGLSLQARGYLKAAIDSYQQIIRQQPDNADAYNAIGAVHYLKGDMDAAIKAYNQALKISPGYAEAQNNMGSAYLAKGEVDIAIACCKRAIEADPGYANAYNNLGHALVDKGDLQAALVAYEGALEIAPESPQAHNNLGNILKKIGNYEQALEHFIQMGGAAGVGHAEPSPMEHEFWVNNKSQVLECLYILGRYQEFESELEKLAESGDINRRVAAVAAFACQQLGLENPHRFCKNPLEYVHVGSLSSSVSDIEKFCANLIKESDKESLVWEPRHGVTKSGYLTANTIFSTGKNAATLEALIRKEMQAYREKHQANDCEFINAWPEELELKGWFVRLKRGGYQRSHIHPAGWLSGVVYLKTIEAVDSDEGGIEFSLHGYDLPVLDGPYPRIVHRPKVGEIILFPSSLFHRTIPYDEETDRCVIAFDAIPLLA